MIEKELNKIMKIANEENYPINAEKAFNILICSLYCYKSLNYKKNWFDLTNENITDGKSDGGIDFIFFDDDNSKVIIGQNKYSNNVDINDVFNEITKINNTLIDFDKGQTNLYNKKLKKSYRNAIDRLSDEDEGNIEILFTSTSEFDEKQIHKKIKNVKQSKFTEVIIHYERDIKKAIIEIQQTLKPAKEHKFQIDESKNALNYESDYYKGIVVNISAQSLKAAFEKFESEGLFNMNIRRYIKSKTVDDAIIESMRKKSDDFWFMNNGITIACEHFRLDGDNVKVYDFSIVNGGQTTSLIAKNLESYKDDFYLMCKIIEKNREDIKSNDDRDFFNNIAEATNSQKAIQPKDLKANAPEMIQLQRILYDEGIFMEIKRGITAPRSHSNSKIKNEEFAQLFYSFVNQRPGTARSSKKSLFSNNSHYKSIFKLNYSNDQVKVEFIKDLINLNQRVNYIIQNIKEHNSVGLSTEEMTILVNGKYSLIAIMGVIYRIVNNDPGAKSIEDLHGDDFKFGTFISNYENDDIDDKLKDLIVEFVEILATSYEREFSFGNVTSPSNFFKTDKKYLEKIADKVIKDQRVSRKHNELISAYGPLFKRVSSRDIDKK